MRKKKQNIAIIGLGLLGTSLGLALKGRYHRIAWARKKESLDYAIRENVCDQACEKISDALERADISIICLPVKTILGFVKENARYFKKKSVVTDIASVKRGIVSELSPLLKKHSVEFIGSHPMAGSERSGKGAAYSTIYKNAIVFITPLKTSSKSAISAVSALWKAAGAKTEMLTPEEHDRTVAATSHLVHLSAIALTLSVLNCSRSKYHIRSKACAGGFKDSTRVAMSSPEMWTEIIEFNADNIISEIEKLETIFCEFRKSLEKGEFRKVSSFLKKAAALRNEWTK